MENIMDEETMHAIMELLDEEIDNILESEDALYCENVEYDDTVLY